MNENKIELQDNQDSREETEPMLIPCPLCETGSVRVDEPVALYSSGRPITLSTRTASIQYHAGIPLGRCNRCHMPIPIEASGCCIKSTEEHVQTIT
jgi:hypothetical protein